MIDIVSIGMTCLTVIPLVVIFGIALLSFFFKSWQKSLLILCRTLTSAILAFFAVFIFCRVVPSSSLYSFIEPILGDIPLISDSLATQELSGAVIYTVLMPFAFTTLFIVLDLLMRIPAFFIGRALKITSKKKKKKKNDVVTEAEETAEPKKNSYKGIRLLERFGSAGIRLVNSFVVIIIVILPISGIIYTMTDGIIGVSNSIRDAEVEINVVELSVGEKNMNVMGCGITDSEGNLVSDELSNLIDKTVAPVRYNFFVSISNSLPVRALCNAMINTTDASGAARNEISQIFDVVGNAVYLAVDFEDYGDAQKTATSNIIGYVSKSDLHSRVVADVVSYYVNDVVESGETVFEGDLAIIGDPLFDILKNTTAESVREDFATLGEIINIMIEYRVPANVAAALESADAGEILTVLSDEDMLHDLMSSIYANEDYRHMIAPIIDFAFTTFIRSFDGNAERLHVAEVRDEYTDDELRAEAEILSDIFSGAVDAINVASELGGASDAFETIAKIDTAVLGGFIDNARHSKLIGDGVTEIMVALLRTGSFDSMREVADILVKHIEEDDDLSLTSLLGAVQQFVRVVELYEGSSSADTAEMARVLRELNQSCDERTAVILKEIIDDSGVLNAAVLSNGNEQKDESAVKVLNVMLDKLTTEEFTDEEYEQEAKAVDYAMQLVQAGSSEAIQDICGTQEERREMIETINESKIASAALIEMAYVDGNPENELTEDALSLKESLTEEDVDNIREECKDYYQEQIKNGVDVTQTETNLKALAAIFDGKISDADLAQWAAEALS